MELNLKSYTHIGDALWEVFIREIIIYRTPNLNELHKLTTSFVNAHFQSEILEKITPELNEEELELTRRARNLTLSAKKKNDFVAHRKATALEALIGFLYINNKERLKKFQKMIEPMI